MVFFCFCDILLSMRSDAGKRLEEKTAIFGQNTANSQQPTANSQQPTANYTHFFDNRVKTLIKDPLNYFFSSTITSFGTRTAGYRQRSFV